MKRYFILSIFIFALSCSDEETTQEQDFQDLSHTFESIQSTANSVDCIDATQWRFTPYGTQACGGPQGFLAYPTTIDTVAFLNRVEGHRIREDYLNRKHGIVSPCNIIAQPSSVSCENGVAVLVY